MHFTILNIKLDLKLFQQQYKATFLCYKYTKVGCFAVKGLLYVSIQWPVSSTSSQFCDAVSVDHFSIEEFWGGPDLNIVSCGNVRVLGWSHGHPTLPAIC